MANTSKIHIFFCPFLTQGHMIPMIDMAKLFASRGVKSTVITTTYQEPSVLRSIEKTRKLGFDIGVIAMTLPVKEVGLPDECQTFQADATPETRQKLLMAVRKLDKQFDKVIQEHRPDCVIADMFNFWAADVTAKFGIPFICFHGTSYFAIVALEQLRRYRPHANISSDSEPFLIPKFPGEITMTRAQLPDYLKEETEMTKLYNEVMESQKKSCGIIMNSFYELEPEYADHDRNILGRRSWQIGPLFLYDDDLEDNIWRGSGHTFREAGCLKWLDSKETDSVVYICFGSMANFGATQLHEIAKGLEASGQQFVWVVKKGEGVEEGKEGWLPTGYEERMQGKGLIIRGWAPQVPILNHKAVGGFVTHCGWNSTLEAISAGVPFVTWPVAAEQFFNEKLITEVLGIGVPVGAKQWKRQVGDSVESVKMEKALRRLMIGKEGEAMRIKAKEISRMAKKAVDEGGSSHRDLTTLLEELAVIRKS